MKNAFSLVWPCGADTPVRPVLRPWGLLCFAEHPRVVEFEKGSLQWSAQS